MAITYEWKIEQMEAYPEKDGFTDVVFTVHWRRQATDGTHHADVYGSQSVTLDADADFTPYANLTQAIVEGWLEDAMGEERVADIDRSLDKQIENLITPPVIRPPLPWIAA